eukprot:COSAG06_NODE_995_length_11158_cov_10.796184_15_plen_206_part_00
MRLPRQRNESAALSSASCQPNERTCPWDGPLLVLCCPLYPTMVGAATAATAGAGAGAAGAAGAAAAATHAAGGWVGVHDEGTVLRTLFGISLWPAIFADVPGVFQSKFQVRKPSFSRHLILSPNICLDRLGTNTGKTQNGGRFLAVRTPRLVHRCVLSGPSEADRVAAGAGCQSWRFARRVRQPNQSFSIRTCLLVEDDEEEQTG